MRLNTNFKQKREIVRQYIQNNPGCTYLDIRNNTKLKVERYYKNMKHAYKDAKVALSKNLTQRSKKEQEEEIIKFIKNNPDCSITQIHNSTHVNVIRVFGGIINAYKAANMKYPEKEVTSGVRDPLVVKRCHEFEKKIIKLLSKFGEVRPQVRIKKGIIDCLFKFNNETFVVEIKDFRGKSNITMSEIKQLIRYMKSLNKNKGLLICPKESFPKRKNNRKLYIENLVIQILSEEDLRGRSIKDITSVQPG